MKYDKRCMCGGVGVHAHGEWHPKAPEQCSCGVSVRDEGDKWFCEGCLYVIGECVCVGGAKDTRKDGSGQMLCIETYPASDGLDRCIHDEVHTLHSDELGRTWSTEMVTTISQEQPQPHGTGAPVGERLIELIRQRTKLGIEKYGEPLTTHNGRDPMLDALQESIDLNQYLMQALMESEDEIMRLKDEQIKPLADFLMQQSDKIGHPGDEGACAMAIRVIGELTGDGD